MIVDISCSPVFFLVMDLPSWTFFVLRFSSWSCIFHHWCFLFSSFLLGHASSIIDISCSSVLFLVMVMHLPSCSAQFWRKKKESCLGHLRRICSCCWIENPVERRLLFFFLLNLHSLFNHQLPAVVVQTLKIGTGLKGVTGNVWWLNWVCSIVV